MSLGFTGTRNGLTRRQRAALQTLLLDLEETEHHHGCCVGADAEFHALADRAGNRIVLHPPILQQHRAMLATRCAELIEMVPRDYLDRDYEIAKANILVACPKEETGEEVRSGTWATVRYARQLRARSTAPKTIYIIRPSGRIEEETTR